MLYWPEPSEWQRRSADEHGSAWAVPPAVPQAVTKGTGKWYAGKSGSCVKLSFPSTTYQLSEVGWWMCAPWISLTTPHPCVDFIPLLHAGGSKCHHFILHFCRRKGSPFVCLTLDFTPGLFDKGFALLAAQEFRCLLWNGWQIPPESRGEAPGLRHHALLPGPTHKLGRCLSSSTLTIHLIWFPTQWEKTGWPRSVLGQFRLLWKCNFHSRNVIVIPYPLFSQQSFFCRLISSLSHLPVFPLDANRFPSKILLKGHCWFKLSAVLPILMTFGPTHCK